MLCSSSVTERPGADWKDVALFLLISTRGSGRGDQSSYSLTTRQRDDLFC